MLIKLFLMDGLHQKAISATDYDTNHNNGDFDYFIVF